MIAPVIAMIACQPCDGLPRVDATLFTTNKPSQSLTPTPPTAIDDRPFSFAIDRIKGRKLASRDPADRKQPHLSRSSIAAGYDIQATEGGRLWLSAGMIGESRRRAVAIAGGRKLVSGTAQIGAGWVQDDHWQLSTSYRYHHDDSKWNGLRRGIELSSGGRPTGSSVAAAIAYSPDFDLANAIRIGIEARRSWMSADDAQAMATTRRDRTSLALTLVTGF